MCKKKIDPLTSFRFVLFTNFDRSKKKIKKGRENAENVRKKKKFNLNKDQL